jgi:hypothetical protein
MVVRQVKSFRTPALDDSVNICDFLVDYFKTLSQ